MTFKTHKNRVEGFIDKGKIGSIPVIELYPLSTDGGNLFNIRLYGEIVRQYLSDNCGVALKFPMNPSLIVSILNSTV